MYRIYHCPKPEASCPGGISFVSPSEVAPGRRTGKTADPLKLALLLKDLRALVAAA
jgi:hypothetical protein